MEAILFSLGGELTEKEKFIGEYLNKHMKGHGFDYSFAYINLLEKTELKAERAWKKKQSLTKKTKV